MNIAFGRWRTIRARPRVAIEVPLNQTLESGAVVQRLQVPSKLLVWPEENHWILNGDNSRFFYREVAAWLGKWVK